MKFMKQILLLMLAVQFIVCDGQISEPKLNALPTAESLVSNALVSEGNQTRLHAVFTKAAKGEKVIIGVLGGSITEGAACAKAENRYPNVVLNWWKRTFPRAQFELVNAGIGATGSNYGAMRVKRDLLSKSPDIVIVEYAVNDPDTKEFAESYEGVVRQILNAPQNPAILILFMLKIDGTNAQEWQTKIGMHYGLPMISYRDAIWPEIQAGRLKWEQISPDQVHPNEAGHILVGELVSAELEKAFKKFSSDKHKAVNTPIPAPLISDLFEYTSLFDGETLSPLLNVNWEYDGSNKKSAGWKSSVPGSILDFEISGKNLYLSCWRINGPMGKVSVSVDGGSATVIDAWFDLKWGGYRYTNTIGNNLSSGKHKVHIELLQDKNEQSTGNEFRVLSLGSAGIQNN